MKTFYKQPIRVNYSKFKDAVIPPFPISLLLEPISINSSKFKDASEPSFSSSLLPPISLLHPILSWCSSLLSLPKPTLTQAINIYSAYNSFGIKSAGALVCTSLGDGYLSEQFGGRNYFSLSAFWGNIAYNAINQVQNSSLIPSTYKIPLNILFTSIAAGMVWKGSDIFKEKHDLAETAKAVKLTASFFDEERIIPTLENEFNKGYIDGLTYGLKNIKPIIANKFVFYSLIEQTLHFTNSFLVQKIFNNIPQTGQLAIFLQLKGGKGIGDIIKSCLIEFCKSIVQFGHNKISSTLSNSIKNEIDQKVAQITLKGVNTGTLIRFSDKINQFPGDISAALTLASNGFSSISDAFFFNQFSLQTHTGESFYAKYPTLVLLEALTCSLLDRGNIMEINTYLNKMIYGDPVASQEAEGTETTTTKMGSCTINMILKPTDYAYQNIQEIAKLGGNEFMLGKVMEFLKNPNTQSFPGHGNDFLDIVLTTIQSLISNLAFAIQLPALQLSDKDLQDVLCKLASLAGVFQEVNAGGRIVSQQIGDIDRAISTLNTLQNPQDSGVTRTVNNEFTLSLKNYHLKKVGGEKDMIYIPELNLTAGKVYAITGAIGTGKTTLLTDIAQCMAPDFLSSGTIGYPVCTDNNLNAVPIIFCGALSFSPPATTLLERVTYRIPDKYRLENKEQLLGQAIELFESFGQKDFDKTKLTTTGNNEKIGLSTGQEKLVLLAAAILYKQYLGKAVLFVMDETLAHLDGTTLSLVCTKIKDIFIGSLVLSVDHNYSLTIDFYNEVIDLSQYKPPDNIGATVIGAQHDIF